MEKTWRRPGLLLRKANSIEMDRRSLNKNKKPSPSSWPQKEAGVTSLKKRMRAKNKKSAQMYMKIKPTAVLPFATRCAGPFLYPAWFISPPPSFICQNTISKCNQLLQSNYSISKHTAKSKTKANKKDKHRNLSRKANKQINKPLFCIPFVVTQKGQQLWLFLMCPIRFRS